jgi:hypothetical protein
MLSFCLVAGANILQNIVLYGLEKTSAIFGISKKNEVSGSFTLSV